MQVTAIDHLVLTVTDIDRSVDFYVGVLGMQRIEFAEGRIALGFGRQKINLHRAGCEFKPNAARATPGSADLCFVIDEPLEVAKTRLEARGIAIIEGPVARSGATGAIESLYFRDPDENLIEVSRYLAVAEESK